MNNIKEISSKETYIGLQPDLKQGKALESCHFDGKKLNTPHHFSFFTNVNLTEIISLFSNSNAIFASQKQAQIREWPF